MKAKIVKKTHAKIPANLAGPSKVKVGFPSGKVSGDLVMRAVWNEFGTAGGASGGGWGGPVPERPFMRTTLKSRRGAYRDAMKQSASAILLGKVSMAVILNRLGILAQGDIQATIGSIGPPNSPVTIARKGSSTPLIDTGEMRQRVTWSLEE